MTPATTEDLREVAGAVRDLAEVESSLAGTVERIEVRIESIERELGKIRADMIPAAEHFTTLNREHAATIASAAEAGNRRRATLDEWLAWLTPKRAIGIIMAILALLGVSPASGIPGKVQAAFNAYVEAP